MAIAAGVRRGLLNEGEAAAVISAYRDIYFPQRTGCAFRHIVCDAGRARSRDALQRFLVEAAPDQKRDDAIALLGELEALRRDVGRDGQAPTGRPAR